MYSLHNVGLILHFNVWLNHESCIFISKLFRLSRYLFAKTSQTGLTTFYGLRFDSEEQTAYFDYRPEGLDEGYRTLVLSGVGIAGGGLHHVAVSVFGADFALFIDGQVIFRQSLIATLEDGPGVLFIGRKFGEVSRFRGKRYYR